MYTVILPQEEEEVVVPGQAIQSGLEKALVGLYGLWCEHHRDEGVRAAPNAHLAGFHVKDVSDAVGCL